jgi:alpha-L-fucosidase 2
LWEKYLYSGDLTYLQSVYPVLKSACEFYQDFLIEEPENKWLVVCPSISPENNPSVHSTSICAGATIDNQLLFDLFTKTIKAASLLKVDSALMVDFKNILDRLPPMQIGRLGQLQEWMEDWDSPDDHNRHVSHLYGLCPSNQISPYTSPKLFAAARTSLIYRGDVSTGWSMGWKVNLWARLQDGNHALRLITNQLTLVDPVNPTTGGTFPNFFDSHPPFQIDGNFGCTSGITEMLLQSHDGAIHFLPALPDDWKTGDVSGLRAYGGFEVSFSWANGQVQRIVIKSNLGGNCRIRVPNEVALIGGMNPASGINPNPFFATAEIKNPIIVDSTRLKPVNLKPTLLYDLLTQAGGTYTIDGITGTKQLDFPIPQSYSLEQNYPNPFNSSTVILFSLPSKSYVMLKVFDVMGREVAALVNEELAAGNYRQQWTASNISSGVYFYRLTTNTGYVQTKKLLLLK